MSTDNLREKINTLNTLLQQSDLEAFQLQLIVQAAEGTTGDPQVDAQLRSHAQNAKATLLAIARRVTVYREALGPLQAELAGTST
jgi:hypothetical protein